MRRHFLCANKEKVRSQTTAQRLTSDEESALWEKGQLGDFNGKVLTNVNFSKLTEQLGLQGRQEHYDAYVEDLVIRQQEDGTEVVSSAKVQPKHEAAVCRSVEELHRRLCIAPTAE